jgi:XisH protein
MGLRKPRTQPPVILAISQAVYTKHFQKPIFQLAIKRNKINVLVYEPTLEVIVQWITP